MTYSAKAIHLAAALALSQAAMADTAVPDASALLDDLGGQTYIATRTKLNIDYAPGTVSILHCDDLMTQGARTVWEALALVPGFEQSMDETGNRMVVVRGVGHSYASGNIKILLNGVPLNSELFSLANPVLSMPIDQIERIEVIRGPGSAIYGESAYMGVVNVITRKQGRRLFAGAGSSSALVGGGLFSFADEERGLELSLNLAGWNANGSNLGAGQDMLYAQGQGASSNAPGPANDKMDFQSAIFGLNYGKFSLSALWLEDGAGDHFGINYMLPPNEKRIVTRQRHRALELKQAVEFTSSLQGEFKLGWQDFTRTRNQLYLGPALDPSQSDPYRISLDYLEKRLTGSADLAWERGPHTLLLGWSFNQAEIAGAGWSANFDGLPANWIDIGTKRTVNSFTLQDQFRASDSITITAGLRHDRYSDLGESTTPRLAAVWQLAPRHILKAQYAEAFRAPTFYELYNGGQASNIQPETIATSELGYLYKGASGNGGITFFRSSLKNLIVFKDSADYTGYANSNSATTQGVEVEGEQWLTKDLKFSANLTWLDTHDESTGGAIPGAGRWLANAGLEYRASPDLSLGIRLRQVGQRSREAGDERLPLASYHVTDISARLFNVGGYKGLTLRGGIKNLFDRDVRFPAPAGTYPGDYLRLPREWWTVLSYSF